MLVLSYDEHQLRQPPLPRAQLPDPRAQGPSRPGPHPLSCVPGAVTSAEWQLLTTAEKLDHWVRMPRSEQRTRAVRNFSRALKKESCRNA
jgi:hypothetical protein